jgi:hypothetical protein
MTQAQNGGCARRVLGWQLATVLISNLRLSYDDPGPLQHEATSFPKYANEGRMNIVANVVVELRTWYRHNRVRG